MMTLSARICAVMEATNDATVVESSVIEAWRAAIAAALAALPGSPEGATTTLVEAASVSEAAAVLTAPPAAAVVALTVNGPATIGAYSVQLAVPPDSVTEADGVGSPTIAVEATKPAEVNRL